MSATTRGDWVEAAKGGGEDIINGLKSILYVENDPYKPLRIAAVMASLVVVAVNIYFYGGHGGPIGLLVGSVVAIVNISMPSAIYRGFSMRLVAFPLICVPIWIVALALSMTAGMGIIGGPVAAQLEGETGYNETQEIVRNRIKGDVAVQAPTQSSAALGAALAGIMAQTVETNSGTRTVGRLTNEGRTCNKPAVIVADYCAEIAELNVKIAAAKSYEAGAEQRRADEDQLMGGIKSAKGEKASAFTEAYNVWMPYVKGDKLSVYRKIMTGLVAFVDLMASILPWGIQQARVRVEGSKPAPRRQLTSEEIRVLLQRPDMSDAERRGLEAELSRLEALEATVGRLSQSERAANRLFNLGGPTS